jgi:flagellar protein FliO/FliZ
LNMRTIVKKQRLVARNALTKMAVFVCLINKTSAVFLILFLGMQINSAVLAEEIVNDKISPAAEGTLSVSPKITKSAQLPVQLGADDNKKFSFKKNEGVPTSYYVQVGFALILIVSIIFAAAWLMRRLNFSAMHTTNVIKVESSFSLGPKEKLLIIRVENERILLGVTSHQINLIQKLAHATSENMPGVSANTNFAEKLQALLSGGAK